MITKLYLDFIEKTLKSDGIKVADIANKKALEMRKITQEQYIKAAHIIVKEYLKR